MKRIDSLIDCPGLVRVSQGYILTETHDINGVKFRLHVHRDAYAHQSAIYADVWSPSALQWNRVVTREAQTYDLPSYTCRDNDEILNKVDAVLEDLYRYTADIIG